jgi:hypothetical protein
MPEFIHPGVFVAIVAAPGASIAEALVEHAERMHYRFAAATPAAASSRHPPTNR